jgi:hypothetical protein
MNEGPLIGFTALSGPLKRHFPSLLASARLSRHRPNRTSYLELAMVGTIEAIRVAHLIERLRFALANRAVIRWAVQLLSLSKGSLSWRGSDSTSRRFRRRPHH